MREVPTAWQAVRLLKFSVGFGDFLKTEIPPKTRLAVTEIDYVIFSANNWLDKKGYNLGCAWTVLMRYR